MSQTISVHRCPVCWLCALYYDSEVQHYYSMIITSSSVWKSQIRFFHPSEILWRRSWAASTWWAARWTLPCHMRSLEPPHPCSSSCPLESTRWRMWRNTVQMHVISTIYIISPKCCRNRSVILKLRCHFGIFKISLLRSADTFNLAQHILCICCLKLNLMCLRESVGVSRLITVSRLFLKGLLIVLLCLSINDWVWGIRLNTTNQITQQTITDRRQHLTWRQIWLSDLSFNNILQEENWDTRSTTEMSTVFRCVRGRRRWQRERDTGSVYR